MATAQTTTAVTIKRRVKRKTRTLPLIVGAVVIAALGWFGWTKTHPAENPMAGMLTAKVARGDLSESVTATGSISAQTGAEVHIGSQITGVIKKLNADVGSFVHAGDLIAQLDLPDVQDQLDQAKANLDAAVTKLAQQQTTLAMQKQDSTSAVAQARAALRSAQAKLASAQAVANQQTTQTPQDIRRAQTAVRVSQAALSTARSSQKQVVASANLQIATAQEQAIQARANATNSAITLKRNKGLLTKGFVAQSVVDQAQATDDVNQSLVAAADQNIALVKAKVDADLQSASDGVTQAQQNLDAARAALVSAESGTFTDAARLADVRDAKAAVNQAQANLAAALANVTQDKIKEQDVIQAAEAVKTAQATVSYNAAQVNKTYIRTPITGTVLQLAAQQGETLAAGLSAPTLIIVADLNRLQADAFVDETDIGKIRMGQSAEVTVDAFPKHVFKGKVVKIASGSTIQQNVVTYDVTVAITENKRFLLKPDMTANVTIETGKKTNVILVPSEAVKVGVHGSTVNVVTQKEGKPVVAPVRVRTGASDGTNTEIQNGLKDGDTIVLAGMSGTGRGFGPASPFGPARPGGGGGGGRGR